LATASMPMQPPTLRSYDEISPTAKEQERTACLLK
jgi:hypothetical protein